MRHTRNSHDVVGRRSSYRSAYPAAVLIFFAFAYSGAFSTNAVAQQIQLGDGSDTRAAHAQRVTLDSEGFIVEAGKPAWVELRFHVAPGFHINSHKPHDELLIPTSLKLGASSGYRVLGDAYPEGTPLRLTTGAGETLSTYGGEFRVRVQLIAPRGNGMLTGTLHYQACDAASCFPPRDLPINVSLSAR